MNLFGRVVQRYLDCEAPCLLFSLCFHATLVANIRKIMQLLNIIKIAIFQARLNSVCAKRVEDVQIEYFN